MGGQSAPPHPIVRKHHSVIERLRAYFIAGILVTGPIGLTLWLTWTVIRVIDETVGSLLPKEYNPATYVPLPGLGLIVAVVGLTFVGALAAGYLGRLLLRLSERIMARMPVIRGVYRLLKQIFQTVFSKSGTSFKRVGLIEFPRRGLYALAIPDPGQPFPVRHRGERIGALDCRRTYGTADSYTAALFAAVLRDRAALDIPGRDACPAPKNMV